VDLIVVTALVTAAKQQLALLLVTKIVALVFLKLVTAVRVVMVNVVFILMVAEEQ